MGKPIRDTEDGEIPHGDCLPCPHVHCEFCEFVIPTVPDEREALRDILIHVRDNHRDEWMSDDAAEFRAGAPQYGVESM